MLRQVNVNDEELSIAESLALSAMLKKREQYVKQGRAREAHGAGTMIWILWTQLKHMEFYSKKEETTGFTPLNTDFGGLK